MTSSKEPHNAFESAMELLKTLGNLPAPEKVYFELQRFNNNMERIQPDLTKLAKDLEGLNIAEIRALTLTLQQIKMSELLLTLREANSILTKLTEHLWGKK